MNLYSYVTNDPINFIDPYGLLSITGGTILWGLGWILAFIEPSAFGEAGMAYFTAARAGVGAANGAIMLANMANAGSNEGNQTCPINNDANSNGEDPDDEKVPNRNKGTNVNPDGPPKSPIEQENQIKKAQNRNRRRIHSTKKSEGNRKKYLDDLTNLSPEEIIDLDP